MPALHAIAQHPQPSQLFTRNCKRARPSLPTSTTFMSLQFPSASGNCWTPVSGHCSAYTSMASLPRSGQSTIASSPASPRSPICKLRGYFCSIAPPHEPTTSCGTTLQLMATASPLGMPLNCDIQPGSAGSRGDGVEGGLEQRAGEGPLSCGSDDAAPTRYISRTQKRTAACARAARARARSPRKVAGSESQRPPISTANTTRWHRGKRDSSG